ncbi:MAG: undecaprenyl-phosphate glucose phosphotransferase [Desulfosporosinus sp.]|nr:undecaprenyl-phosphate glucose phosphotransferase [Desulfosporosinus sp.]
MIRENQKTLNNLQVILDLAMVVIALAISFWYRFLNYQGTYLEFNTYIPFLLILLPLYFFLYYTLGLYEPGRRKLLSKEVGKVIQANLLSMLVLFSLLYLIKEIDYSRQVLILFVIITSILTTLERAILRTIISNIQKKGYNKKQVIVIGTGRLARRLISKLKENKYLGFEIVGIIDDNVSIGKNIEGVKVIGGIGELESIIDQQEIDEIFITISTKDYDQFRKIIKVCEKSGVRSQIVPDYARFMPAKPQIDDIDGIPLINIRHVPLDNYLKAFAKRTFDIIVASLGLLICLPFFIFIAISITADSSGPAIFSQERVGLNKKSFMMHKFRTMKVQTEENSDVLWTTKQDLRKTRLGSVLRRTSLDELPQLWNVLKGEMSLVGPRPERPYFVEQFKEKIPRYMVKHQIRPGITGWAQINGWRGILRFERGLSVIYTILRIGLSCLI